ncbi:MAG: hypothetical protein BKP49_03685 [Treponema sp. CETP13]|nr:MAG: hypothetical protein BKP49_03685 [Treponema sp. CETP13]
MRIKKYFFSLISFVFLLATLSAAELSIKEQEAIDNFMQFRVNLTSESDAQIILKRINQYQSNLSLPSSFSAESKLIIENFITLEKYNYMYTLDIHNPKLPELILPQKDKNDKWFDTHDKENINKWLYCTAADVISCCMQFVSKTDAMKMGLTIKDHYKKALSMDSNMSYALFGMGQWLIQAPGIAGGSKKGAIEAFELSLSSARNNAERFYAYVLLSQGYYEGNKKDVATSTLQKAIDLAPNSTYPMFIKLLNDNNYSLYYYITHREKIDKKLHI